MNDWPAERRSQYVHSCISNAQHHHRLDTLLLLLHSIVDHHVTSQIFFFLHLLMLMLLQAKMSINFFMTHFAFFTYIEPHLLLQVPFTWSEIKTFPWQLKFIALRQQQGPHFLLFTMQNDCYQATINFMLYH